MSKNPRRSFLCSLLALALSAPALGQAASSIHKVRGFLPDLRFSLQGAGNATVTQDDFSGKVVLLFFGYASCPDICPTTMAQLTHVVHELDPDGSDIKIVFISVDPHRDTPEKLQAYVRAFERTATGLTGSEAQIAEVARRYRVAYQIEKPKSDNPSDYEVTHGRGVYVFDRKGRARLLASDTDSVASMVAAVQPLLSEGG